MSDTYLGLYRGIVEEGVDPAAHGRLRVSLPSVLGGDPRWAERSVDRPGAAAALPPGTMVWVQFEGGNTERPVVVGCAPSPHASTAGLTARRTRGPVRDMPG